MKNIEEIESFNNALEGLLYALKREGHMKIHYAATLCVLILALFFNLTRVEFMILVITCAIVIMAEMFNTCIELIMDFLSPEYSPKIRKIKDVAAGAVLVVAISAALVGYLLFFDRVGAFSSSVISRVKQSDSHLAFIALCTVILLVLGFKAKFSHHGTYFKGGRISGHSAVAFCLATMISLIVKNFLIIAMVIFLAALVAESRVESGIHSMSEVVWGAFLGIFTALFIFLVIG